MAVLSLAVLSLAACGDETPAGVAVVAPAPRCDPGPSPAAFAPGVDGPFERPDGWFGRVAEDPPLVDDAELTAHRARTAVMRGGPHDPWSPAIDTRGALADARRRLVSFAAELRTGVIVEQDPGAIAAAMVIVERAEPVDHGRLVVRQSQLHCTPAEAGFVRLPERDASFDRNACTTLHPGELVRVLARGDAGRWWLVDAGHTLGWVRPQGLSVRITDEERRAWRDADRLWALRDDVRTVGGVPLRMGVGLPVTAHGPGGFVVRVAGRNGPHDDRVDAAAAVSLGFAPLRRRAVLEAAFAQIGAPYGWGGRGGARDCSQFLRDTFAPFGVALPRHSSTQALAGLETVDVAGLDTATKLATIARLGERGLVLEYMPGHIMLDVGTRDGKRWSISAIAEFLVPCPGGVGDTVHRLDRVALADLELGRGTARGAFIDRITTLAVFGRSVAPDSPRASPGEPLGGLEPPTY